MSKGCLVVVLILISLSCVCSHVSALGREGTFGLYPVEFKGELSPGQSEMFELFIFNNTNLMHEFTVTTMGCGIDRGGARYYPSPEMAGEYSAAKWLTITGLVSGSVIRIPPYERHAILVEVHVPSGTRPGEYYAVVFIEPTEYSLVEQEGLKYQAKTRIGAVVKVLVPGPISAFDMRSSVKELKVSLPSVEQAEQFGMILENLDMEGVITENSAPQITSLLKSYGIRFVYDDYKAWGIQEQQDYAKSVLKYLEQIWMEEETVKITATFETEARKIILAKGEVSVYQEFVNEDGRRQRILRDRFTLTPSGSDIKGEEKVFPGGMRDFYGTVQRPLPIGDYTAEVRFEYRGEDEEVARLALGVISFSISEELAVKQRQMLVLGVSPDLLVYDMAPGEYHVKALTVENLDVVDPLVLEVSTNVDWIELSSESFELLPGKSRLIRVAVKIPRDAELVQRAGKILISTNRGKAVYIDVQVCDKRDVF
jgi:hypothetical protein